MLGGCKWTLMDPKGQIGLDQRNLIITATLLMLLVVVPVIIMTFAFAWKYRASNTKATYGNPEKDFLIWQNLRTPIAELFNEANDLRRCRVRR
ncbi:hypothetical protein TU77_26740 [Pseudomonas synxantha]|nr:hypothetical protein TU77_26740 [Pseudomonas synxantha]